MSFEAWTIFAAFWVLFVTTPGPNAVNCINNGITLGFWRSLPAVAGILTQASLFLTLSALGVTALIAGNPAVYDGAKLIGAAVLIYLGIRGWLNAAKPVNLDAAPRDIGLLPRPRHRDHQPEKLSQATSPPLPNSCSPTSRSAHRCG